MIIGHVITSTCLSTPMKFTFLIDPRMITRALDGYRNKNSDSYQYGQWTATDMSRTYPRKLCRTMITVTDGSRHSGMVVVGMKSSLLHNLWKIHYLSYCSLSLPTLLHRRYVISQRVKCLAPSCRRLAGRTDSVCRSKRFTAKL